MTTPIIVLAALIVGFVLGSYFRNAGYQNRGEARLARSIRTNFKPPDYHLLNHVTLSLANGTTQVDHILVSRFGVYVIETKDYKGWIFADSTQVKWTQVLFRTKFKFRNPILQNSSHVSAVQGMLTFLPQQTIRSAVVFVGEAEFKTSVPLGVYSLSGFIDYLRQSTQVVMSSERMHLCVGMLEASRLAISRETDVEHVQNLERRYGRSE